ncbi:MAG: lysophospholipid acyltransferase family protein, partial [Sulfurovum sp.]|nr:lysophospholipid acyltransferase family protein [Sulfurovum sp.]
MIRAFLHILYGMYLTNSYGLRLKLTQDTQKKKRLRIAYSQAQLNALGIKVKVKNPENLPEDGQYLLVSNHRSVIDPLIIELALKDTKLFGLWISKKELYYSPFFGLFVRNAGSILLDREKAQMSGFFAEVKKGVQEGHS